MWYLQAKETVRTNCGVTRVPQRPLIARVRVAVRGAGSIRVLAADFLAQFAIWQMGSSSLLTARPAITSAVLPGRWPMMVRLPEQVQDMLGLLASPPAFWYSSSPSQNTWCGLAYQSGRWRAKCVAATDSSSDDPNRGAQDRRCPTPSPFGPRWLGSVRPRFGRVDANDHDALSAKRFHQRS